MGGFLGKDMSKENSGKAMCYSKAAELNTVLQRVFCVHEVGTHTTPSVGCFKRSKIEGKGIFNTAPFKGALFFALAPI